MQVISMTRGKIVQDYLNGQEIKMPVLEYHGRPALEFQILRIEK